MALPLLLFALFSGQEAVSTAAPEVAETPPPATAPAAARPTQAEYTPEGAPKDDYNFTAWCHGVLSGHMALAERVQSVLPLDEVQQKIGKAYLKGYEEALAIGKRTRSPAEIDAADAIRAAARANWSTAMKADLQLGADTYLAWQLPGRCEHAAIRVAGRADLFRMAPTVQDMETFGGPRDSGIAEAAPTAPAPAPARTAPAPVQTVAAAPAPQPVEVAPSTAADYAQPSLPLAGPTDYEAAPAVEALAAAPAPEPEAVAESAPAETQVAEAAPPEQAPAEAEPAPAATAEAAPVNDGRIVRMPRKGRLFPWGKRE